MITKKGLAKRVEDLTDEVKELNRIVVTDELRSLREAKKAFDEQTELLSHVRLGVKSAKVSVDGSGAPSVVVTYRLPIITIPLDEGGEPSERVPFFYAVNALGLVGMDDYDVIRNALAEAKKAMEDKTNKK